MKDGFRWCPHCAKPHALSDKFCPSTGQPVDVPPVHGTDLENLMPGTVIDGKYEVIAAIGRGGAGVVYEGKHLGLGLLVALKFLKKTSSESMLQRFEQEARLSASIGHPNICRVHDIGRMPDGGRYIVMERLRGETLGHRLARSGKLPAHLVVHLFSQVVSALGAAHAVDVVHRDIKPGNIFIEMIPDVEPHARVLDFGCAKPLKGNANISRSGGVVVGTPIYMSPEQIKLEPLDGRSDLFACGVSMFEALTGRLPFPGPSRALVQAQILRDTAPLVSSLRPDVPPQLANIIARALEKQREQRFANASEMLGALRAIPNVARPSFVPDRLVPSFFADDPPSSTDDDNR